MRRVMTLVATATAATLALAACGGSSSSEGASAGASSGGSSGIKVGLSYDIGGRGDKSFNDSAASGLDQAASEFGIDVEELEASDGETDAQKAERLRGLAEDGNDLVIAVGYAYATALAEVAPEYPDTRFAIIDDSSITEDNVTSLVFAEEQGSYLVGVIAAQASATGNVGFVGGVNTPLIQKFEAGYTAGVKAVAPDATVQVKYLTEPPDYTGFSAPDKAKTVAEGMYDAGADIVYQAAGGSGTGVFEAASAAGKLAIGVDSDQYLTVDDSLKSVILTSMLKRVDTAVYSMIQSMVDGEPLTGIQTFDLTDEGVSYSVSNSVVDQYTEVADDYKTKIASGEITVPSTVS